MSKKQTVQFSTSLMMSLYGRHVGGGMVVVLFTLIFSKPTELSYVTPYVTPNNTGFEFGWTR